MASSTDYYPHQTNHNYQSSHTYSVHSIATYQLPCKSKKDNEVLKVENDSFVYLSEKRVINWCNAVDTLYPIKTPGDGNCLLHAISIMIYGYTDDFTSLREKLYSNMVESDFREEFRNRWQARRTWLNESIPDGGLQYTDEEWDLEWNMLVSAADPTRTHASGMPNYFESLEEFHVFVLANTIRRPIIILGEPYLCSITGENLEHNDFVGIYLPLMWPADSCCPSPVILAFQKDHLMPLLFRKHNRKDTGTPRLPFAVPLVTAKLEQLPIRYLYEKEESQAIQYLERYLMPMEVTHETEEGKQQVLAASLRDDTFRTAEKCSTDGCRNIGRLEVLTYENRRRLLKPEEQQAKNRTLLYRRVPQFKTEIVKRWRLKCGDHVRTNRNSKHRTSETEYSPRQQASNYKTVGHGNYSYSNSHPSSSSTDYQKNGSSGKKFASNSAKDTRSQSPSDSKYKLYDESDVSDGEQRAPDAKITNAIKKSDSAVRTASSEHVKYDNVSHQSSSNNEVLTELNTFQNSANKVNSSPSLKKNKSQGARCINQFCQGIGSPQRNGLCESCFMTTGSRSSITDMKNQSHGTPSRSSSVYTAGNYGSHCRVNYLCKTMHCNNYGDIRFDDYCESCFIRKQPYQGRIQDFRMGGWDYGERMEREPTTGVWGQGYQRGSGAEPPMMGRGRSPLKLKNFEPPAPPMPGSANEPYGTHS